MANIILDKIKGHPHITEGTAYAILFTMGLCHLLNDMIQSVIPAIYPLLKDSYGFTFAQIGIITLDHPGVPDDIIDFPAVHRQLR